MMGFKSFWLAAVTLAGIELMHMIRKGQLQAAERLRPANHLFAGLLTFMLGMPLLRRDPEFANL
jgi:hypothetical protein